ncbi:MAG: hypothetical protein WAZ27_03625 [Minisyncoccia bacterium]
MYKVAARGWMLLSALAALLPYYAFAQTPGIPERIVPCNGVDCKCQDLITLAQNIINSGIFLAIFLSAMLFAYAGWLYLTQETIQSKSEAKSVFTNVFFGLTILLSAWLIVDTLMGALLKDNVSWSNICASLGL